MKFDLDQCTIQLTKGNLISLPDAEGSIVAVLWGSVWLTQNGHRRDYEVNAGESFTIRGDGLVLISAFENSTLTILQHCENVTISSIKPSGNALRRTMRRTRGIAYPIWAATRWSDISAVHTSYVPNTSHPCSQRWAARLVAPFQS